MRTVIVVVLVLLGASPTFAQEVLTRGEPFSAVWDHDGANTTEYRLYLNDLPVPIQTQSASLPTGTVTFAFPSGPSVPDGTYQLRLSAVGPAGESVKSTPLTVIVRTPVPVPSVPTNGRITRP